MKTKNLLGLGIAILSVISSDQSCASFLNPNGNTSLIEEPLYQSKGDFRSTEESRALTKKLFQKIKNHPSSTCDEKAKSFAKKEDVFINSIGKRIVVPHTKFPLVSAIPVIEDQFATNSFFRENSTGKFYVARWANDFFPIEFHLTEESKAYYKDIQKVFDYVNERAKQFNLTFKDKNVLRLASTFVPLSKNTCNTHVIHVDDTLKLRGLTYNERVLDDPSRLGQIYDSDIMIPNPKNPTDFSAEKYDYIVQRNPEIAELFFQKIFQNLFTHEIMHALGVGHNFAFGTVIDYLPRTSESPEVKINDDETEPSRGYEKSLAYEMEVLKFLYKKDYVKPETQWPLVRSTTTDTTYNMAEMKGWLGEKNYTAIIQPQSSKYICVSKKGGAQKDLSSEISRSFDIKMDFKKIADWSFKNYTGIGGIELTFTNIVPNMIFAIADYHRLFPVIDLSASSSLAAAYKNNEISIINKKILIIQERSEFTKAFSKEPLSEISWSFHTPTSSCDLQVQFTLKDI